MGILTGLFKSIMLTRMINTKQHRLTQVMSRMRRLQKESTNVEKQINAFKRSQTTAINSEFSSRDLSTRAMIEAGLITQKQVDNNQLSSEEMQNIYASNTLLINQKYSQLQEYFGNSKQFALSELEDRIEAMKEEQLEPIKDEEEDLEVEKQTLETQIKMYEQWKQGAQEETQSGIKNFKPLGSGSSYG